MNVINHESLKAFINLNYIIKFPVSFKFEIRPHFFTYYFFKIDHILKTFFSDVINRFIILLFLNHNTDFLHIHNGPKIALILHSTSSHSCSAYINTNKYVLKTGLRQNHDVY